MSEVVKIAIGQLLVEGGEPTRNFQRAKEMIEVASAEKSDIILFPETIDFAWTHPSLFENAKEIPGEYSDFFCEIAKKEKIFICIGLTEKRGTLFFNSAILINEYGEIILKYSKINLLKVEQPFYSVGNVLKVVDTKFGKIGINICADNYKDSVHIGKTLGAMGARIILSPSSWTVDYDVCEDNKEPYGKKWLNPLSYIAKMYDLLVVSATSVGYIVGGPYEGKKKVGCSLAVNSDGVIAEGPFNEFAGEVIYLETSVNCNKMIGTELLENIKKKGYISEIEIWENKKNL
jgi:predicted amidohydrolase